jgi:hypothetical protein
VPSPSFKTGLAISALAGLLLSILSISMQSMPECGLLGWSPFCGRLMGGAPIGYFPFEGVYDLPELTLSVVLFALNDFFWVLPFFFTFGGITVALRKQLLQSKRAIWVFELLLLAPVFLWLAAFVIEASGITLPRDLAFHVLLLPEYVGNFLLPSSPVVEALDVSERFAILFYICLLAFSLALVLVSLYKRDRAVHFRYPIVAGLILFIPVLLSWASLATQSSGLQQQEYPFQIMRLSLSRSAETGSDSTLVLEFQLQFFDLPEENKVFEMYYCVYNDPQIDEQQKVGAGTHVDYLKQQNGIMYGMAPGTILRDNQFVVQDVVSGAIQIKADGQPKYLHVWISEAGGEGPRRLFDYVVPIEP